MSKPEHYEVAVIGAGSIGLSVAYYLGQNFGIGRVCVIDALNPMSLTSAQSGENYRNWWPNPVMTAFTNHSIGLMEKIAEQTDNRIQMTRRGYALVTRQASPNELIEELYASYRADDRQQVRLHQSMSAKYEPAHTEDWKTAPDGVDVLLNRELIRQTFPYYATDVASVLHIRRAGSISAQQLGQFMLENVRAKGGVLVRGKLNGIGCGSTFELAVQSDHSSTTIKATRIVNAAGPFLKYVAQMLGETLNVTCVYQQKIAFEDRANAIDRSMPFTIDLDGQQINWTEEEREALSEDPANARFLAPMPGGMHCRPEGAFSGKWIKIGWAYNHAASDPYGPEPSDTRFPDIALRGASRLHPRLAAYIGHLPRSTHHYGGYYTMTEENWPLIGPMATPGAFVAGAFAGFGSMAACAAGELCAAWVAGSNKPAFADVLSPARFADKSLMAKLAAGKKGHL